MAEVFAARHDQRVGAGRESGGPRPGTPVQPILCIAQVVHSSMYRLDRLHSRVT